MQALPKTVKPRFCSIALIAKTKSYSWKENKSKNELTTRCFLERVSDLQSMQIKVDVFWPQEYCPFWKIHCHRLRTRFKPEVLCKSELLSHLALVKQQSGYGGMKTNFIPYVNWWSRRGRGRRCHPAGSVRALSFRQV